LTFRELSQGSRQREVVKARSVLSYWVVKELGMSGAQTARWLGICQSAVHRSVLHGLRRFRSRAPMTIPMMIEPNTRTMIVRYSINVS
jgi:hypothetical protein